VPAQDVEDLGDAGAASGGTARVHLWEDFTAGMRVHQRTKGG
jgi:hypothetical protein